MSTTVDSKSSPKARDFQNVKRTPKAPGNEVYAPKYADCTLNKPPLYNNRFLYILRFCGIYCIYFPGLQKNCIYFLYIFSEQILNYGTEGTSLPALKQKCMTE